MNYETVIGCVNNNQNQTRFYFHNQIISVVPPHEDR